jgi:protease-4
MPSRLRVLLLVLVLVAIGATGLALVKLVRRPLGVARSRVALVWDVPSELDETPPNWTSFSLAAFRRDRPSLWEVTNAIRDAATDDDVRALVLHVDDVEWGWSRVAEMREALAAFRAAGKPVYACLEGGTDQAYLLVSGSDRLAMPPTTTVFLDGLSASAMFLKGTYDKLGITPNFAHVGQYKSAVEQYTRTSLSEPSRRAMEALLDDQYGLLVDSLAAARHVTPEVMRAHIDDGPFTASAALAEGLADTLLDEAGLDSLAFGGNARSGALASRSLEHYAEGRGTDDGPGDQVALIPAVGTIVPGRSHDSGWSGADLGSETLIQALREARQRRSVRAIVLRIDSPGGSGQASDDVWQEIRRTRRVKPVVVSMSNLAASGGYYIACGADAIVAEPSTITGSIGVFGGKLNLLGLYHKLGLNVETVSRGRHAEMMSAFRDFTPEEAQRFQAQLEDFYRVFLGRVSLGRGIPTAQVDSIGQGRVWSGGEARRFGLVDTLGGLRTAIAIAKQKAHLEGEDVSVVLYPHPRPAYFQHFLAGLVDDHEDDTRIAIPSPIIAAWMRAARFPVGAVLALMPYSIDIR